MTWKSKRDDSRENEVYIFPNEINVSSNVYRLITLD